MTATVIQKLKLDAGIGNEIYVKRDDLLPFSIGGNKVRISEAFYADMQAKGCDTMIIYGSRHSNLCRVLSNLCCSRGTDCVMICSHEADEEAAATNNTALIEWAGAQVVNCGKQEIAQTVERVMSEIEERGGKPYYIYGNKFGVGNEGTAASAYADAYAEIQTYEKECGKEFDYIICPSGTGATQTGLICGHLLSGDRKKILGIMISSRETKRAYQVIEEGIRDYFAKHDIHIHIPEGIGNPSARSVPSGGLRQIRCADRGVHQGAVPHKQPAAGSDLHRQSVLGHAGVLKDGGHHGQPDSVPAYRRHPAVF